MWWIVENLKAKGPGKSNPHHTLGWGAHPGWGAWEAREQGEAERGILTSVGSTVLGRKYSVQGKVR